MTENFQVGIMLVKDKKDEGNGMVGVFIGTRGRTRGGGIREDVNRETGRAGDGGVKMATHLF